MNPSSSTYSGRMTVLPFQKRSADGRPGKREQTQHRELTRCETCAAPTIGEHPVPEVRAGFVHVQCRTCDHTWWMPERRMDTRARS